MGALPVVPLVPVPDVWSRKQRGLDAELAPRTGSAQDVAVHLWSMHTGRVCIALLPEGC